MSRLPSHTFHCPCDGSTTRTTSRPFHFIPTHLQPIPCDVQWANFSSRLDFAQSSPAAPLPSACIPLALTCSFSRLHVVVAPAPASPRATVSHFSPRAAPHAHLPPTPPTHEPVCLSLVCLSVRWPVCHLRPFSHPLSDTHSPCPLLSSHHQPRHIGTFRKKQNRYGFDHPRQPQ